MLRKVVIITGASRGLGRAMALHLGQQRGVAVVLAARDADALTETAAQVTALGGQALAIPTDVTSASSVQRLVDQTAFELGRLDVLINNAGIAPQAKVADMTDDDWRQVMAVNLDATFFGARAVAPIFEATGSGRLINIASVFGLLGRSGFAAYGSSKAAVINMTRVLAVEWARFGAQVNAIAPGYISTDINQQMRSDDALMQRIVSRIPSRRMGEADEVANLATYLAVSAPNHLTGQVIAIDGGESAT